MTIANTNWYRNGTIGIAKNATKVYGTGTQWLSVGINPGATLRIDGTFHALEILAVVSDTEIDLRVPYTGDTITNTGYSIDRNFQSTIPADLAAGVAAMTSKYERYIDSDLQKITGESAYDIAFKNGFTGTESEWLASLNAYGVAKNNGFTGTESEWLNSLKAAGEWEEADTRISTLESDTADYSELKKALAAAYESPDFISNDRSHHGVTKTEPYQTTVNFGKQFLHKSIYRGKNLGAHPTAAQLGNVKNGTYEDLYLGDYWEDDIDITYPVLDGADVANGDTFTNEASGRRLAGKVRWVIVDMGYYANYATQQIDDNPLEGAPYAATMSLGNIVVMPTTAQGYQQLAKFYKADGTALSESYGLGAFPMNYKKSNECGYRYSIVRTKILPAIYEYLLNNWGLSADHFRWNSIFSSVNSTSSNWDHYPLHLPAFSQIMGGLSNIQIKNTPAEWTMGHYDTQFQLFKLGGVNMLSYLWHNVQMTTRDMFAGNTVSFVTISNGGIYSHTNTNSALSEQHVMPYLILY